MTKIKGTIKWEHITLSGMPFYVVRDAEGIIATLYRNQDEYIEYFLSALAECLNYDRAEREVAG